MDAVTAAISNARSGQARVRLVSESGPYGLRMPAIPHVGFHVLRAGDGWLITTDAAPVALRPGDVVFVAAGVEHGMARVPCTLAELPLVSCRYLPPPAEPVEFEFLCGAYGFPQGTVPEMFRRLPTTLAWSPDYVSNPELRTVIDMLAADFARERPGHEAIGAALIDLVIAHILGHLQKIDGFPPIEPGIAAAVRGIHDHPERPWTLVELSELARMSRSAFIRTFRAAMGTSPIAYLTDRRLTVAAGLLLETTDSLAAVARRSGYSTPFALTAAFRRKYGVPPGQYRSAEGA